MAGEIFENIRLAGDLVPKAMEIRYGFIPDNYKKASYLSTVSRMLSTGLIERKIDTKGEPYLELTGVGEKEFKRRFPLLRMQKAGWDGFFMQVVFDIPEKKRNIRQILRLKLRELGFGMLQESVFISPYHFEDDFAEFLAVQGLTKYVYVMKVKRVLVGDVKELARKVWKIEEINAAYQDLIGRIKKGETKGIEAVYLEVFRADPLLPKDFLPDDWARERLMALMKNKRPFQKS